MTIQEFFEKYERITVALSGGVDSAVLLFLAKKYAKQVNACFVKSQFQPDFEENDAKKVAKLMGVEITVIETDVLHDENIVKNDTSRCYYCKKKMFSLICKFAAEQNSIVVEGTNASDDVEDRAGFKAINQMSVLSPLRLCGYDKKRIREIAKQNNIPVFDKPSYACLATRVASGICISKEIIDKIRLSEQQLFLLGYKDFRIRYNNCYGILEFSHSDMVKFLKEKDLVYSHICQYYDNVYLNLKERDCDG